MENVGVGVVELVAVLREEVTQRVRLELELEVERRGTASFRAMRDVFLAAARAGRAPTVEDVVSASRSKVEVAEEAEAEEDEAREDPVVESAVIVVAKSNVEPETSEDRLRLAARLAAERLEDGLAIDRAPEACRDAARSLRAALACRS